ncbi:MAG: hypothetical protein WC938_01090 [Candidatus Paceibacterota bacterium]|jgi:hypothetical protein
MKLSIILIVAGIVIAIIGGIVLMNNAQEDNVRIGNIQTNKGQVSGEDRFKPQLVDLDAATQAANNAGKPRLPAANPIVVFFIGVVMVIVGVYDAYRTKNSPGLTK